MCTRYNESTAYFQAHIFSDQNLLSTHLIKVENRVRISYFRETADDAELEDAIKGPKSSSFKLCRPVSAFFLSTAANGRPETNIATEFRMYTLRV